MPAKEILFSFEGRIPRSTYWLYGLLLIWAINGAAMVLDRVLGGTGIIDLIVSLLTIWPSLAVAVKRAHDRNRSGWSLLIVLIPVIGWLWWLIELGLLRGTEGDNRFGPDPLKTPERVPARDRHLQSRPIVPGRRS